MSFGQDAATAWCTPAMLLIAPAMDARSVVGPAPCFPEKETPSWTVPSMSVKSHGFDGAVSPAPREDAQIGRHLLLQERAAQQFVGV